MKGECFVGKVKIDGVPCSMTLRGVQNGVYTLHFQRPEASLERIEQINWARPHLSGPCELPAGYGFKVERIDYHMGARAFSVTVKVLDQYLGDITGYQAQIDALTADKTALEAVKTALEGQLAEADETAIALYEELEAALAGPGPATDEDTAPEGQDEGGEVTE